MLIIGVCADVIKTLASHIGNNIFLNMSQQGGVYGNILSMIRAVFGREWRIIIRIRRGLI